MTTRVTNKCLNDFKATGKIDEETAKAIINKANKIANSKRKGRYTQKNVNDPEILKQAADEIIADKVYEDYVKALDLQKKNEILEGFKKNLELNPGRPDLAGAAIFANIDGFRQTATKGIEAEDANFRTQYFSQLSKFVVAVSKKKLNDPVKEKLLVRELLGEAGETGNPEIIEIANEVRQLFSDIADDIQIRGGKINKLDKYIPQNHDSLKLKEHGEEDYINDTINLLDWDKMTDSNGDFIPPEKRKESLSYVFETLITDGLNKLQEPKEVKGKMEGIKGEQKAALRNKYAEERFLIFKDADAFYKYHEKYGKGSVTDVIINHVNSAANDVATLQVLGPKTSSSIDMIKTMMTINNAKTNDLVLIDKLYREVSNDARAVADPFVAAFFSAMRILGILPNIGSVMLSALADLGNSAVAGNKYGFQSKFGSANRMFKNANNFARQIKSNIKDQEAQIRINGQINHLLYQNHKIDRFGNEISPEYAAYGDGRATRAAKATADRLSTVSNFLYKYSGLTGWTEAHKSIAIREVMDQMASVRNKNFSELDEQMQKALRVAGITEDMFSKIKKANTETIDGVETFTIESIFKTSGLTRKEKQDIYSTLNTFGQAYAREAVPEAGAYIRAKTTSQADSGDVGSEIIKTLMQFKRFPITYMHNQLFGDIRAFDNPWEAGAQIGLRMSYGLTLGMAAVQISEMANGRSPKETDWKLVIEGFFKSGGMGIAGDILFTDFSGRNRDVLDWAAGPTGSTIINIARGKSKLVNTIKEGFGVELEKGEDSYDLDAGSAIDVLDSFLDYGNMWYTKEIVNAAVDKLLREKFDDDYLKKKRKEEKKLLENNQETLYKYMFD